MKQNWKTSIMGVLTLGMTGFSAFANPEALNSETGMAQIVAGLMAGLGLLAARDPEKKEKPPEQTEK